MNRFRCFAVIAGVGALLASAGSVRAQAADTPPGEKPVDPYTQSDANAGARPYADDRTFKAFHGEAGVRRIVDDLVERALADGRISEIFKNQDLARLKRTLAEQVCYLLDGPCRYSGRDMKAAHKDLGIRNADFNAVVEDLQLAMDKEGVPFHAQNRLLAKLAPMHKTVVER